MPEKMRTDRHGIRALGAGAVRREKKGAGAPLRLAFDAWGANDVEGAGAGSRSQAGLGGDKRPGRLGDANPYSQRPAISISPFDGVAGTVAGRLKWEAALRSLGG
jgi:hypothetical protein